MITRRGARATSWPERTLAYARMPSILIAETADGTCISSPRSAASAVSICSSVSARAPTFAVTAPSASSVTVEMPSRMVASYAFFVNARYPSKRVALPIPTTRTPVAIGSSVPACPTFRVPASRRILATTWWEVQPAGLSRTTTPDCGSSGLGRLVIIARCAFLKNLVMFVRVGLTRVRCASSLLGNLGVHGPGLSQQVVDLSRVFRYSVGHEGQRGGELQAKLLANLSANQAGRRPQRGCGGDVLLL